MTANAHLRDQRELPSPPTWPSPTWGPNIVQLQGWWTCTAHPAPFYDPGDASTALKVVDVRMDIYEPDQGADSETARPVVLQRVHTGDALPPP